MEGAHLDGHALRQRVDFNDPRAELELGAVGDRSPVTLVAPWSRQLLPLLLRPVRPQERVGVRHLVVEDERAAGLEVLVQAAQPLDVVLAPSAEPEAAADDDRAVAAGQVELVHRLRVEIRLRQSLALAALADALEHVGRDVASRRRRARPGDTARAAARCRSAASSAGWPASTNGRNHSISGPSRLNSAHQRETRP